MWLTIVKVLCKGGGGGENSFLVAGVRECLTEEELWVPKRDGTESRRDRRKNMARADWWGDQGPLRGAV